MKLDDIINRHRDYIPESNSKTISDFMEGTLHSDFLNELSVRIEDMRDFNEECDSKNYLETRGGIKALRLVAGIFNDLYNNSLPVEKTTENEV